MSILSSPWSEGKCAAHMMRPTAGVARWRERPSAVFFVGTLRPRPLTSCGMEEFFKVPYAFGLPLGLLSFEFRAVFWPVGFPGFWPLGSPPPATRLDFRILGPVGKDLSNGPFAEVAWALRILPRQKMTQVDYIIRFEPPPTLWWK